MSEFRVLVGHDWAGVRAGVMALRMEHGTAGEVLRAFAKLALEGFDGDGGERAQTARLIAVMVGFRPIQLAVLVRMMDVTGRAPEPALVRETVDGWKEHVFAAGQVAEWARGEMNACAERDLAEEAEEFGPLLHRLRRQAEVDEARRAGRVH